MFILIPLFALLVSCAKPKAPEVSAPPPKDIPGLPKLTELDSQRLAKQYFLEGLNYKYAGKLDYASLFFEKAHHLDPASDHLTNTLAEIQRQIGSSESAMAILKSNNRPLDSLSEESLLLMAHLSLDLNQHDSADVYYDILTRKQPNEGKYWWEWAQSLEEVKNYHKLADVNRQLIDIMGYPEQFIFRQILLYSISKRKEEIPPFLEDIYKETGETKWLKDALERYEEFNNKVKVQEILTVLLEKEPYNLEFVKKSIKLLPPKEAGQKLWEKWKALNQSIPQDSTLDSLQTKELMDQLDEFPVDAARLLVYGQDYSTAKIILDSLIIIEEMNANVWSLSSGAEFMLGDTNTALERAKIAYEKSNEEYRFASLYVKMLKTTHNYQEAEKWLKKVRKLNQDPLLLNLYVENHISHSYYINHKHYQDPEYSQEYQRINLATLDGLDSLKKMLPQEDPDFPSLFLLEYRQAITLEKLDSIPQLQVLFEKLIKEDPKNAGLLNYYGYTLIDRDLDLAKGQVLVEKALAQDPQSTAYLDSKAWGLLKQGKAKEALEILEAIEPKQNDDFYILEHLAECYKKLGRQDDYLKTLEKIQVLSPHHPILKDK